MSIVEKAVVQIPTTKGLGQATDSLLTGDAPLVVRNLVQDRQGRWSKRPGLQEYGYSTQDGEIIYNPRFCFATRSGLALVANKLSDGAPAGRFVVAMDSTNGIGQFRGRFPEFCAKQTAYSGAPYATQSGLTEYAQVSPRIIAVKKFGNYVGTVQSVSLGGARVDISSARDGQTVRSYGIQLITGATNTSFAAAVSGDRLHVYAAYSYSGSFSVSVYEFNASALPTEAAGPTGPTSVFSVVTAASQTFISAADGASCTWVVFSDNNSNHRAAAVNQGGGLGGVYSPGFAYNGAIATDGTYGYVLSSSSIRQFDSSGALVSSMGLTLSSMTVPKPTLLSASPSSNLLICAIDQIGNSTHIMPPFPFVPSGAVGLLARSVLPAGGPKPRALAWLPSTSRFYALLDRGLFGGYTTPLPIPLTNAEWYGGGGTGRAWVADVSEPIPVIVSGNDSLGGRLGQLRTVATLETSLVCGALGLDVSGGSLYAAHVQAPSQSSSVGIITDLSTDMATATHIPGNWGAVVTGAAPSLYDGSRAGDMQFPQPPSIFAATSAAGAIPAGTYSYVAVMRFTMADGRVMRSETSDIVTINRSTAAQYTITVQPPTILSRSDSMSRVGTESCTFDKLVVELYRTTTNGKVFYLVSSTPTWTLAYGIGTNAVNAASLYNAVFTDATSDLDLATRQKCYRNPGVAGTSLQREPAPASIHGCVHKDRLFLVSADGNRIFSSSYAVDGEGAWFSPGFQVQVPGGNGRVVALASLDNRLVVFRERGVFLVDGDGPPENGGNGTEFSPPQQVSSLGCTDSQSVVTTDNGVYFRSHRGIELLTRKYQVEPIGDSVLDFTDTYPVVKWSLYDQENDRVMFCLTDSRGYTGDSGNSAVVVCYDQSYKCWSELRYFSYGRGLAGGPIYAPEYACSAQLDIYGNTNKYSVFGVDYQYYVCQFVSQLGADFGSYVPTKWQGAWRFNGGPDGRQRIYDWQVIGKSATPCTVTLSLDYDFSDATPQTRAFTDAEVTAVPGGNAEARRLVIQPNNQASESMRFTVEDTVPTVGAPGTGRGWSFYGIALEGGPKAGVAKIAKEGKS